MLTKVPVILINAVRGAYLSKTVWCGIHRVFAKFVKFPFVKVKGLVPK